MSGNHGNHHDGHHDGGHHPEPQPYPVLRSRAIESLLIEKRLMSTEVVDKVVSTYEQDIGPMIGARVVARAWTDPEFKRRLLADGTTALEELGVAGNHITVLESTPEVHNVVVCTLCSCYPWAVLGLPPTWYKDFAYRSRAVLEPRKLLAELGTEIPDEVEIRVWDSSSEVRYMVLPERPAGTEGLSEDELAALVTRDAMIGVARVKAPATSAR